MSGTSNKLSSVTGALARTYAYNADGSVFTSGVATHTYYNSGRMKTAKLGAAATTVVQRARPAREEVRRRSDHDGVHVRRGWASGW